jgi:zinc protease
MIRPTLVSRLRTPLAVAGLFLVALGWSPVARAIDIQQVVSPGGIEAWLVQDSKIPIVAIKFAFVGGIETDPVGKEGLANLASSLLDEGAGPYDSEEFQRRLADNSIGLNFDAGVDAFFGSVKTLTETGDEAWELTRLALTAPRFEAEAVERMRNAVLTRIRRDLGDPDWIARRTFYDTAYPGHPYGRRARGTPETVAGLTADDLRDFVKNRFARDNLLVAASGDITPERLGSVLDRIFGGLPEKAVIPTVADTQPKGGGETVVVPRPQPQSVVLTGQPGLKRNDPDWFAAYIMNYVLGGGSFNSRLMDEIRVKRGLSYGVYSYLLPFDHSALVMAGGSTANPNAGPMIDLMKAEWRRMAEQGITQEELEDAKTFLTGSFPLQFTSTDAIADVALQVRRDNLGIDYLSRRDALINAVTLDDVKRVAGRLLAPEKLLTVVVGQPESVKATRTVEDGRS